MSALNDPALVAREYADDSRLAARIAAQQNATGPDPRQIAFEAVAEAEPQLVLEVGPGRGELAERMKLELDAARGGGRPVRADGRVDRGTRGGGDRRRRGRTYRSATGSSTWRWRHGCSTTWPTSTWPSASSGGCCVPDGRLVAVTNSADSLHELWSLVGYRPEYSVRRGERRVVAATALHDRRAARRTRDGHLPRSRGRLPLSRGVGEPRGTRRQPAVLRRPARRHPPRRRLRRRAVIRPAELIERKRDGGDALRRGAPRARPRIHGRRRARVPGRGVPDGGLLQGPERSRDLRAHRRDDRERRDDRPRQGDRQAVRRQALHRRRRGQDVDRRRLRSSPPAACRSGR